MRFVHNGQVYDTLGMRGTDTGNAVRPRVLRAADGTVFHMLVDPLLHVHIVEADQPATPPRPQAGRSRRAGRPALFKRVRATIRPLLRPLMPDVHG